MAEWLTRRPAKPFPFGSAGSNPAGDVSLYSSVEERQSCKLEVPCSIHGGGNLYNNNWSYGANWLARTAVNRKVGGSSPPMTVNKEDIR